MSEPQTFTAEEARQEIWRDLPRKYKEYDIFPSLLEGFLKDEHSLPSGYLHAEIFRNTMHISKVVCTNSNFKTTPCICWHRRGDLFIRSMHLPYDPEALCRKEVSAIARLEAAGIWEGE